MCVVCIMFTEGFLLDQNPHFLSQIGRIRTRIICVSGFDNTKLGKNVTMLLLIGYSLL